MREFEGNLPLFTELSSRLRLELKAIVINARFAGFDDNLLIKNVIFNLECGISVGYSIIGSVFSNETKQFLQQNSMMNMQLFALYNYVNSGNTFLSDAYGNEVHYLGDNLYIPG